MHQPIFHSKNFISYAMLSLAISSIIPAAITAAPGSGEAFESSFDNFTPSSFDNLHLSVEGLEDADLDARYAYDDDNLEAIGAREAADAIDAEVGVEAKAPLFEDPTAPLPIDDFASQMNAVYIPQGPESAPQSDSDNFFLSNTLPTWHELPSEWEDSNPCGACYLCYHNPCGTQRRFVDFLYWQLSQNGLEFAMQVKTPCQDQNQVMYGNYKKKCVNSEYKPGFRVGALFAMQNWEFGAIYTYLHSTYRDCLKEDWDHNVICSQLPEVISQPAPARDNSPSAQSKFHLSYDTLDLVATASYITSNCWTWRPYLGIRFLDLKEQWKIAYPLDLINIVDFSWTSKVPAAGATCGLSGIYALSSSWNILGRLGFSAVGGMSKESLSLVDHTAAFSHNSCEMAGRARVRTKHGRILGGMDGVLGLAYVVRCQNGIALQAAVGYEFQSWCNVPMPGGHPGYYTPAFHATPSSYLTLHGLVVRFGAAY